MTVYNTHHRDGFTLVELSIVLVVIGLLVGGIIAGSSMMRTGEIRGVIAQITKYSNAVTQFKTEFNAYPGDLSSATSYWGIAAGGTGSDATCYNALKTSAATCNGSGNNVIDLTNPATPATTDCTEGYLLWQHLSNAGLIEGKYSGRTSGLGNCGHAAGTNSPSSSAANITFTAYTAAYNAASGDTTFFTGYYDTILTFGTPNGTNAQLTAGFNAEDMWNIDKKLDDGFPQTGNLRSYESLSSCNSGTDYNLMNKSITCAGIFGITNIR